MVLNVIKNNRDLADGIEPVASSEVFLTLEISLAMAALTVLWALRATKRILLFVFLKIVLVSYGFMMYLSFSRTWIP